MERTQAKLFELLRRRVWLNEGADLHQVVEDLMARWTEPHRHWHGINHMWDLLEALEADYKNNFALLLAIVFHDAIYDPRRGDNEHRSAELFKKLANARARRGPVVNAILRTKDGQATTSLERKLIEADRAILKSKDWAQLIAYEHAIAKEYQHELWSNYVRGRVEFLNSVGRKDLASYVAGRRPKMGVFAGSFDPFHNGHMDVLDKATAMFDRVIVAIAVDTGKKTTTSADSRHRHLVNTLPFHDIRCFSGLLVPYMQRLAAVADVTLVRGVRSGQDLDYEINIIRTNEDLGGEFPTVLIPCGRETQHISSTMVRSVRDSGHVPRPNYRQFVPALP